MSSPVISNPILRAEALVIGYGGESILPPLSFEVARGQTWALFGHNGGGKTSLLRTLLGLLPATGGAVDLVQGKKLGYVPQRTSIDLGVPQRVIDVVKSGSEHGYSFLSPAFAWRQGAALEAVMRETKIDALAKAPFATLSEGQKQRVLLARALLVAPDLLVLDEPTSAMDMSAERAAFRLIDELQRARGFATLIVTHHVSLLAERASHAILVDKDSGVALTGTFDEVTSSGAFIQRYGFFGGSPLTRAILSASPEEAP